MSLPGVRDVYHAASRIADAIIETPLVELPARREGGRVFAKLECLQRTGSFKFRGAMNRLRSLSPEERARGVVAFSSGNHGFAVAEAARLEGSSAVIVVPADAPRAKVFGMERTGARIVTYDRARDDREAISSDIAEAEGRAIIEPFDHAGTIVGQGTLAIEALRQGRDRGVSFARVLCCVGGGGLIAGVGLVMKDEDPAIEIVGVEPEGAADTKLSLALGTPTLAPDAAPNLCDGLMTPKPGAIPFALNFRQLSCVALVSDAEICAAMRFAFETLKVVVEPSGAAALAAYLHDKLPPIDAATLVIVTGGNVDAALYAKVLSGEI